MCQCIEKCWNCSLYSCTALCSLKMTTRTLDDSDQSCPGTRKRVRVEATAESSGLAEVSESTSHAWPNVIADADSSMHKHTLVH